MTTTNNLREIHRLEWENKVISLINQGWSKSDAEHFADEILSDKYRNDDE